MAQKKITDLVELTSFAVDDLLILEDISAGETKAIQASNLLTELYLAGVKKLEATTGGITIGDGTASGIKIFYASDNAYFDNADPGGNFYIRSRNAGNTAFSNLLAGDPDGAVDLYYAGVRVLYTALTGIYVSDGTNYSLINSGPGGMTLRSAVDGGLFLLRADQTDGTVVTLFSGDPDGATLLYHNAIKSLETRNDGLIIYRNGSNAGAITGDSFNWYLQHWEHGVSWMIQAEDTGGTMRSILKGDPDGAATLYYAGTGAINTGSVNGRYGITFTQTSIRFLSGAGSPEGVVAAVIGSAYLRTDGGAGTCFYVKETGTGNTGWVAK